MPLSLDDEIYRLYGLEPAEFVQARNELAKRLRAEKDRDSAARVQSLAKPSHTAWAVNRVFWSSNDLYQSVIRSGDGLRAVQQARLKGEKKGNLEEAIATRRQALRAARRESERALTENGHSAGLVAQRRLEQSWEAIATYGSSKIKPDAGRLTRDLAPPGFEVLAALASEDALPLPKSSPQAGRGKKSGEGSRGARERLAQLEEEREARRRDVEKTTKAVLDAQSRAQKAAFELTKALRHVKALQALSDHAEKTLRRARSKAEKAESAADEARKAVARLSKRS